MMSKFSFSKGAGIALALFLFLVVEAQAQNVKVFGYCERGGQRVMNGGSQSTTTVQRTYPGCTVRVMDTGTATLTSIFTNSGGTAKSNPFVASTTTGYWEFYVPAATRLDIQLSGGVSPNNIATPFYWVTDMSAAGASLPTLYNQGIIEQVYDAPSVVLPTQPKIEIGAGLNAENDAVTGSTLIKSSGSVTGKRNIVTDYGGNSLDTSTTGTISSGSTSLTMTSLLSYRKGMYIAIPGLGVAGVTFYARITDINTATKVFTLDASPAGNGTGVTVYPDNFTPIQNALNELSGSLFFPAGFYRVWNDGTRVLRFRSLGEGNPTMLEGDGQGAAWVRAMGNNDLFRATSRAELTNLQIKNMSFDTHSSVRSTTKGWAFNLGDATVVNFPQWENVQVTGFRGAIFCNNCQGGGIEKSVFRFNKSGIKFITDQSTWLAGNENNVLTIKDNQLDFQADPDTDSDRAVVGLAMVFEADNAVTDASYTVTAATSQFQSDDVGRIIEIPGEGTDGGNLVGMIMEYISATQVKISTRGVRTAGTAFSGAAGTIWRIPTSSMYFYRANWLTLQSNILQGNFGASTANVNSVVIRSSNSVNFINHYSEQGGGAGGAHVRLIDSYGIKFDGFKTNSQGACVATPPNQVTSHCWDIWATNTPGTRVQNASGSLSILHNKLEGTSTIYNESLFGAPDLSNETGPQKQVYGDYHQNFQWGAVQIGTNTLYDNVYGEQYFLNPKFRDGGNDWTLVVPGSVTFKSDGTGSKFKYYARVDTTALATASVTELLTQRVNIPDGLMAENYVLTFNYRPVTYPSGSDDTYTVDFYAKPSSGGTGYNWPTTFNWQVPGNNAAGLTTGFWYTLQVNLKIGEGTGRYFDIAIRGRRGALTPIVDFTNFRIMQGRHGVSNDDQPITQERGGKIYGDVYIPALAGGTDLTLGLEATTGKLKVVGSGGGGGAVSSVGLIMPSWLTVSGTNPITTSGTFTVTSATALAGTVLAAPSGSNGALSPRALVDTDIPGLATTKLVTGVLAVARGGTGLGTASDNTVMIGDGTGWNSTAIPSCSNATTSKLLYNTSTRTFTCGTDQSGAGSGGVWGSITGTLTDQTDLVTALGLKANLAGPTFTGVPAAPTASTGTNTTQLATTAFVNASIAAASGSVAVQDESVGIGSATTFNFVGAGVTATFGGSTATITIPGGGGSGSSNNETVPSGLFIGTGATSGQKITNCSAIQTAITATYGVGVVRLPAGTVQLDIACGFTIAGDTVIVGSSKEGTIVTQSGTPSVSDTKFFTYTSGNVSIKDVTFNGTAEATDPTIGSTFIKRSTGSFTLRLDRVKVNGFAHGVSISSGSGSDVRRIYIDDSDITVAYQALSGFATNGADVEYHVRNTNLENTSLLTSYTGDPAFNNHLTYFHPNVSFKFEKVKFTSAAALGGAWAVHNYGSQTTPIPKFQSFDDVIVNSTQNGFIITGGSVVRPLELNNVTMTITGTCLDSITNTRVTNSKFYPSTASWCISTNSGSSQQIDISNVLVKYTGVAGGVAVNLTAGNPSQNVHVDGLRCVNSRDGCLVVGGTDSTVRGNNIMIENSLAGGQPAIVLGSGANLIKDAFFTNLTIRTGHNYAFQIGGVSNEVTVENSRIESKLGNVANAYWALTRFVNCSLTSTMDITAPHYTNFQLRAGQGAVLDATALTSGDATLDGKSNFYRVTGTNTINNIYIINSAYNPAFHLSTITLHFDAAASTSSAGNLVPKSTGARTVGTQATFRVDGTGASIKLIEQ